MTKLKIEDALLNFQDAAFKLMQTWDEDVNIDSPEEIAISNVSEKYPFVHSFEELYPMVRTYVNAAIEEIERQKMLRLFDYGKESIYVMAIKEINYDEDFIYIERHWFCKAELLENDEVSKIEVFIPQTASAVSLSIEEFKENFITIPKELYQLAMIASNNEGQYSDIVKLAKKMGEEIK